MYYILIVLVIILDQASKFWIQNATHLHGKIPVIPNFLYITYVKNTGAAWSILKDQQLFLILVGIVETILLVYFFFQTKKEKKTGYTIALALMIGGAIGNLIDRFLFGYVRDFIDTYPFGYDFPVFNIADCALCIGVALLMLVMMLEDRKEKQK